MKKVKIFLIQTVFLAATYPVLAATITFTVNPSTVSGPISPYIYGANSGITNVTNTLYRSGGNRLSAYNWETNWSNAGSDYLFENDTLMGSITNGPGWTFTSFHTANKAAGADSLVTIQLAGYVSANGETAVQVPAADYMNAPGLTDPHGNFYPVTFVKGAPYADPPNNADGVVYTDEMVNFLVNHLGSSTSGGIKFYDLDNEPGAWAGVHAEIHNYPVSYFEVATKGITVARQTTLIDPGAQILGPVCYGWGDAINMGGAPDQGAYNPTYDNGNWVPFLNYYLAQMNAASAAAGRRLLHYLDFHAYSEGTDAAGNRINNADVSQDAATTRMQLPRELWDPTYTENNWISCCVTYGPMTLIPRFQAAINQYYPGTKVAFSEYDYGGGGDVSGGVAEADALGAFGRYGLGLACLWDVGAGDQYLTAAFNMYLNYDGAGSKFGDTSISATSSNVPEATVWAARDNSHPNRINVVVLNKDYTLSNTGTVNLAGLAGGQQISSIRAFRFDSAISVLSPSTAPTFTANSFTDTLPFRSGTLYEVTLNQAFATYTPTATNSPLATATFTPTVTATPTGTLPSATFTSTKTFTPTITSTPTPTVVCSVLFNSCDSLTANGNWTGTNATRSISTTTKTQGTGALQVMVTTGNTWNDQMFNLDTFTSTSFANVVQLQVDINVPASLLAGTTYNNLYLFADSPTNGFYEQSISSSGPSLVAGWNNNVTFTLDWPTAGFISGMPLTKLWFIFNSSGTNTGTLYVDNIRLVQACATTPTATHSPTTTSTNSPTKTATNTATSTPTNTPNAPTNTLTNSPTRTPTSTATNSPTLTSTSSPTLTRTNSATATPTNSATRTPTSTPSNSATNSPTSSSTATMTNSPTMTPTNTHTNSPTITSTPTDTFTGTLPPTNTATQTPTNTLSPTGTNSATRTPTATSTNSPTNSLTTTPSNSPTPTVTLSPTKSATSTPTNSLTWTTTQSPTSTMTNTPTNTPLITNTATNSPTNTYTKTATHSPTLTMTYTATNSPLATATFTPTSVTVSVTTGPGAPPSSTQLPGTLNVPVDQVVLSNPNNSMVTVTSLTLTNTGTGTAATAITNITLSNNGVTLGTNTFTVNTATFSGLSVVISPGGSVTLQVNANFSPTAPNATTYQFNLSSAAGTNGQAVNFNGVPYTGAIITIATVTPTSSPTATSTPTASSGKIILYPNPSNGTQPVSLRLNLTSPSNVKVQVFTTAFRKVLEQSFSQQPVGMDIALNLVDQWGTPLASGLYYVVVFTTPSLSSGQHPAKSVGKLLILR